MNLDFCVDRIAEDRIDGWAWAPDQIHDVPTIELLSDDGAIVARADAGTFRIDLATADKRAGWCGFSLAIPNDCAAGRYRLRARIADEACEIATPFFRLDRNAGTDLASVP